MVPLTNNLFRVGSPVHRQEGIAVAQELPIFSAPTTTLQRQSENLRTISSLA
jgi:hypothetical protein